MTIVRNTFAAFNPVRSHNKRIAAAVQDTILGDEIFRAWQKNRCHLGPDPLMETDDALPNTMVAIVDELLQLLGSRKNEMLCSLEILFTYEEFRDRIEPDEGSAMDLIWHTGRLLSITPQVRALQVPRYDNHGNG